MSRIKLGVDIDGLDKVNENIENAEKSAGNLRKEFVEARKEVDRLAASDVVNQDELDEAIRKMAEIKDELNGINEEVNIFASGSKYEVVSNAFGSIGKSLVSLDFGKAEARAQSFAKAASNISFGDAITSLKQLGNTFVTVGRALLTNPLFLLGAVLAGIALAIGKVMKEMGLLKIITEAVGKVFDGVLKVIENLIFKITDFFGITNKEQREATAALEENTLALQRNADAIDSRNKKAISAIDNEIRMNKLLGKETEELERQKIKLIQETQKARLLASVEELKAAKASGKATEEEINKLKQLVVEQTAALKQTNNDLVFFDKQQEVRRQQAADKEVEDRRKLNERLRKEREAADKKDAEDRLKALKTIEDLVLQNAEEGIEKEIELNRVKYERLIEDTKNNENLLQNEKDAIIEQLRKQEAEKEAEIRKEFDEKEKEDLRQTEEAKAQIRNEFRLRALEGEELEIEQQRLSYEADLVRLNEALNNELISETEHKALLQQLEQEHSNKLDEIRNNAAEKEKAREEELRNFKIAAVSNSFSTIANLATLFADGNEKTAKRAFEIQKAASIGEALVNTYSSATAAFKSLSGIPVVGPGLGIAAAAAATSAGLANVAAIRRQKFGGSAATVTPPVIDQTTAPDVAPTPPSFFGDENVDRDVVNESERGSRQIGAVRTFVVESDISETQSRLNKYQQRSEIG